VSTEETPQKEHHRIDYPAFEENPTYKQLKKRQRGFVWPVLIAALAWYILYVILATYASKWMATPIAEGSVISIGLVLGLGQFVTTFVITQWYVSYANKKLDPLASDLRSQLEAKQKAGKA